MTHEQKMRILELSQAGFKDKRIAELLDLSMNTVKSYRQRNKELIVSQDGAFSVCPQCAQPFPNVIRGKRFCSVACKTKWWNERHDMYKNTTAVGVKCQHCGVVFSAYPVQNRKFCSHGCYIAHRYDQGVAAGDKK